MKTYTTPGGEYYNLYADMLQQTHILIAGATGSGKSVVINGILHTALMKSPNAYEFILIDLKRVELAAYRKLPHTIEYADNIEAAVSALHSALRIIETRYSEMQRTGSKKYSGSCIYVVIDELADLMTVNKKAVLPLLQRIAQIGRAANVKIIAATQCPLASVIPTQVKVNFDTVIGLHTRSAQDSRNILGCNGCESLPRYGQGYYMTPAGIELYYIPMYDQAEQDRVIRHWSAQRRPAAGFGTFCKAFAAAVFNK